jgi:hypothetical protein
VKTLPFQHRSEPTSRTSYLTGSAFPLAGRRALRIEGLLLRVSTRCRSRVLRRGQSSLISGSSFTRLRTSGGIGVEGDAASTPPDFSGCGEFPALLLKRAVRSRRRTRSASLSGVRHGLTPKRNGQLGHLTAVLSNDIRN